MSTALIIISVVLCIFTVLLALKIICVKRAIADMREQLPQIMQGGTNKLITVADSSLKNLAVDLNEYLAQIRQKELKYDNGDREVKVTLTNAAHDIRTPITAISGYLDLLDDEQSETKRKKYLSVIRERTETLAKLSEQLFAYSIVTDNFKNSNLEKLDAAVILKQCIADCYEEFCNKGITPLIDIPSVPLEIVADQTDLMRMFSNIITNALKYSSGDFKVCVSGRNIAFCNSALNIDAIDVNRLFDRFYTVNNGKSSTGLGLSIAKIICERIGGEITATKKGDCLEIALQL